MTWSDWHDTHLVHNWMITLWLLLIIQPGFINGVALSNSGKFIACAIGQEHKLGRWWHLQDVKNCVCIIDLQNTWDM